MEGLEPGHIFRNQQVAGSTPAGGSIFSIASDLREPSEPFFGSNRDTNAVQNLIHLACGLRLKGTEGVAVDVISERRRSSAADLPPSGAPSPEPSCASSGIHGDGRLGNCPALPRLRLDQLGWRLGSRTSEF